MSKVCQDSDAEQDFPYNEESLCRLKGPLYPPPTNLVALKDKSSLAEALALDQPMTGKQIFAIFVSIPYCRTRCHSCHFFKGLIPSYQNRYDILNSYLDCLEVQIRAYGAAERFSSAHCSALYMGGGTASLLASDQVNRLVQTVRETFVTDVDIEITLEGNPSELTHEYLREVQQSGVNRLSIGIQSFQNANLEAINTPHRAEEGREALEGALAVGFDSINIDLLYKVPGQSIDQWRYDLETALGFDPGGISIYRYRIHPGSASERLIASGRLKRPVDKDTAHGWYLWSSEQLNQHGYTEHMRGTFARAGHEQKYGALSFHRGSELIGVGAGAHGFINRYNFQSDDDAEAYKEQVYDGLFPVVDYLSVQATNQNLMERYMILGFIFSYINRQSFYDCFGQDPLTAFPKITAKLTKHNLVLVNDREIRLTDLGKKWRYHVCSEFVTVNQAKSYKLSVF